MNIQDQIDAELREITELVAEQVIARMDAAGVEIDGIDHDRHGPAVTEMLRDHFALSPEEAEIAARYSIELIAFRAAEREHGVWSGLGGTA